MEDITIEKIVKQFIKAANQFDVTSVLNLFAEDAVIDDISVGEKFKNISGIQTYIEKFFVGYNTVTKLVSLDISSNTKAKALVDFTGDFGHETGGLDITLNAKGLISSIDAYLD